jgi:opacity protein-like surface antigen
MEGGIQRMPVMLWAKIISDRRLSPFLQVGAGMAKTDYRENASARSGPTIRFHEWHFSWGLGGGMNYQVGSAIAVELFVEDWVTEKDILGVNSRGRTDGIFGRNGMYTYGVRAVFSL